MTFTCALCPAMFKHLQGMLEHAKIHKQPQSGFALGILIEQSKRILGNHD